MSRVGKKPVDILQGVKVEIKDNSVFVNGPLGKMQRNIPNGISVKLVDNKIQVERASDSILHKSLHGLTRTLIFNMVEGVNKGFSKQVQIEGVGYRANVESKKITLNIGFTKPVEIVLPDTISAKVDKNILTLFGVDKELIGELTAKIRAIKKPEPYKGRGIKYVGEHIIRKSGKAAATTTGKGKV